MSEKQFQTYRVFLLNRSNFISDVKRGYIYKKQCCALQVHRERHEDHTIKEQRTADLLAIYKPFLGLRNNLSICG